MNLKSGHGGTKTFASARGDPLSRPSSKALSLSVFFDTLPFVILLLLCKDRRDEGKENPDDR